MTAISQQASQQASPQARLQKLADAFVEPDDDLRRDLLQEALTVDAKLRLGDRTVCGLDEASDMIREKLKDPGFGLRLRGKPTPVPDGWDFSWRLGAPPSLERQRLYCEAGEGGKIACITLAGSAPLSRSPTRQILDWATTNVLAAVAVVGGAIYVAVRLPLTIFYDRLGTSPARSDSEHKTWSGRVRF